MHYEHIAAFPLLLLTWQWVSFYCYLHSRQLSVLSGEPTSTVAAAAAIGNWRSERRAENLFRSSWKTNETAKIGIKSVAVSGCSRDYGYSKAPEVDESSWRRFCGFYNVDVAVHTCHKWRTISDFPPWRLVICICLALTRDGLSFKWFLNICTCSNECEW